MANFVVNKCMNLIKTNKPELTSTDLEIIQYGITGIYLTITKLIVIITLAILLNQLKETLTFICLFGLLRNHSYGLHAKNSWVCLIMSIIMFIPLPYLATKFELLLIEKYLIGIISVLWIFLFSPADTHKRPIVNKIKRKKHKLLATLTAIILLLGAIFIDYPFLENAIIICLLLQCIFISPITYKIFNLPYNNYLRYQKEERRS